MIHFYKASAFNISTVVSSMPLRMGSGLHLLYRGMATSLINANIPLLCKRLKGQRPVNALLFPLRDSGREGHLTGGLTESGQYHNGRSLTPSFPHVDAERLLPPSHCTGSFERYKVILY